MNRSLTSRLPTAAFFTAFILASVFVALVTWVPAEERIAASAHTVPSAVQAAIIATSHMMNQPAF